MDTDVVGIDVEDSKRVFAVDGRDDELCVDASSARGAMQNDF